MVSLFYFLGGTTISSLATSFCINIPLYHLRYVINPTPRLMKKKHPRILRYICVLLRRNSLLKTTIHPIQVHARYAKCSSSSRATCNCAVAIKSGDDVITFTGCNGGGSTATTHGHNIFDLLFHRHHNHHHHSSSHTAPIAVALYKNGQLTPGTYIRRYGCGQKYEVRHK